MAAGNKCTCYHHQSDEDEELLHCLHTEGGKEEEEEVLHGPGHIQGKVHPEETPPGPVKGSSWPEAERNAKNDRHLIVKRGLHEGGGGERTTNGRWENLQFLQEGAAADTHIRGTHTHAAAFSPR